MSDCPNQKLIETLRSEITAATGVIEKFEEDNGADLAEATEHLEEATRVAGELERNLSCSDPKPETAVDDSTAPPPPPVEVV